MVVCHTCNNNESCLRRTYALMIDVIQTVDVAAKVDLIET